MSEQPPEPDNALTALSTVLNRVHPTVVVRRRVYDVPPAAPKTIVAHRTGAEQAEA